MARGPFIKWEQVIRDLVALLGVNTPQNTRREQIADAVGIKTHALDKLIRQLKAVGALEVEAVAGPFRPAKPGGKPTPVRTQQYTITKSADDILFLGKKRDIKWGQDVPNHEPLPGGHKKIEQVPAERLDAPSRISVQRILDDRMERIEGTPQVKVEEPVVATVGDTPSESPFAVLKPLKADSPAALIEAARQYRNQHVFIDEKIAEFAAHGLTLDPAIVGLPVDERLEHIGLVVEYVSKLEGTNERLQKYANEKGADESLVRELRAQIARQDENLSKIAKARAMEHEEAVRLSGQHSGKVATLTQRIQALEQENRDLKNKVHNIATLTNGQPSV